MSIIRHAVCVLGAGYLVLALAGNLCYGEDAHEPRSMNGTVTATDWVASKLVVDDTEFIVGDAVKIRKGADTIGFSEIEIGDPVVITYYQDTNGTAHATKITVLYSGEFAV